MKISRSRAIAAASIVSMLVLSSCDKAKQLAEFTRKLKSPSGKAAAASKPGPGVENYPEFISQTGKVVVVDFNATWCGPCKLVGPMLDKIADEQANVVLGKIDVDQHGELAKREGVSSIPDIRVYVNGSQVDRIVGAPPEPELRARIEKQLAKLGSGGTTGPAGKAPPIAPASKDWMPQGMKKR